MKQSDHIASSIKQSVYGESLTLGWTNVSQAFSYTYTHTHIERKHTFHLQIIIMINYSCTSTSHFKFKCSFSLFLIFFTARFFVFCFFLVLWPSISICWNKLPFYWMKIGALGNFNVMNMFCVSSSKWCAQLNCVDIVMIAFRFFFSRSAFFVCVCECHNLWLFIGMLSRIT